MYDFSEFPILHTERLCLRQMRDEDVAALFAIFSDAETVYYLTDQNCTPYATPAEAKRCILDWTAQRFEQKKGLRWALTLIGDDTLIGTAGINWWDRDNHCAEIGYDLNREYWGQGLMPEAVHAILRWAFMNLAVQRIEADTTAGNLGSVRVLQKCAFVHEGTARRRYFALGRYWDNLRFGLLRDEYKARFGPVAAP